MTRIILPIISVLAAAATQPCHASGIVLFQLWLAVLAYGLSSLGTMIAIAQFFLNRRRPGRRPTTGMDIFMICCLILTDLFLLGLFYDSILQVVKHG